MIWPSVLMLILLKAGIIYMLVKGVITQETAALYEIIVCCALLIILAMGNVADHILEAIKKLEKDKCAK